MPALPDDAPGPEIARVRERFERVLAAGIAIFAEHELATVLQRIADAARDVVGATYAAIGVLDESGTSLTEFVTSGLDTSQRERIGATPRGLGLLGTLIHDARPLRTRDINTHPHRYGFPPNHPPMRSFLGVPILGRTRVFGNLYLTEKIGGAEFSDEDERIAVLLAAYAAGAIENARLHEESQRLLVQIQGMQRQRDLFFAMMNHELRNSLTGVYGWAEMLVRGKDPSTIAPAALEVYESAERTIELLNNFLDLTRLDAGKVRPVIRDVEVAHALERSKAVVLPAANHKSVAFNVQATPPGLSLRTDPVRLEQILVNLLSNAVRHTPASTTIELLAERAGESAVFRVIDRGPGVDPALTDQVFEPFERFDPHSGLGTGLGLPVSRRLAEVLGGTLVVERAVPGDSIFCLTLPLAPSS